MKNFNFKAISSGIILLISSGVLYFLIILLINTTVAFDQYRNFYGQNYRFAIDKNDQKFLLKSSYDNKKEEIYDLEKKLLRTEEFPSEKEPYKYLAWENCRNISARFHAREWSGNINLGEIVGKFGSEKWYFLTNQKYMIGYDKVTAKVIGYFGANGFSAELKDIHNFDEFQSVNSPRDGISIVVTNQKGYCIQIPERKMLILEKESDEKINYIYPIFDKESDRNNNAELKGFVLNSDVRIKNFSSEGKLERSLVFPKEILKQPFFSYLYNGKLYVKIFEGYYKTGYFYVVKEISPKGEVLWEYTMDKFGVLNSSTVIDYNLLAVPFMGRLAMNTLNRYIEANPFESSFNLLKNPEFRVIGNIDLSFWLTIVLAIMCMIFVYSHLTKRTDSRFIIYSWLLVILVISLPGLMAYLFYTRNAKLINCANCGNKFLPIKSTCLICNKDISLSKADGREIFTVT